MSLFGLRPSPAGTSYTTLLQSPDSDSDKEASRSEDSLDLEHCPTCGLPASRQSSSPITTWAIIVCLLCTAINALLAFSPDPRPTVPSCRDPLSALTKEEIRRLRRPSPFIGLANITRPSPPIPRSLINYPQVIAQVDREHKDLVFDDDPLRHMTHTGSVSPEGKQVRATKSISTILQFRAIDFGMETCELKLRFPVHNTTNPFMISLHRLAANTPLDTKTLSYRKRPSRITNIANIRVPVASESVVDWNGQYACQWDELLTFELGCFGSDRPGYEEQNEGCSLMWWQDQASEDPSEAIYVMQHATV
ncbi:hypothetical protein Hypma_006348 [Hypsizygus marmoreus]|uniref:Ubiquitin 3 binding protein But2 C-terminal domain-containing protein n=1 Tax=Hypsizygus marmoreus TaxID=39966 RepID=A0A369JX37_HYPMA|nr:hypothetical protein Hypma_006348 [Hypsizygus marmoreus]